MGDMQPICGMIAGHWVANEDMHPMTNIAGRKWMTKDGELHGVTFPPNHALERGIMCHFPVDKPNEPKPDTPKKRWAFWR